MSEKKMYHTIGQVSEFTDLPQSVIRYWESVFPRFSPQKSPGGNRLYSDEDIKLIEKIKDLLYVQKFTIKGANVQLEKELGEPQEKRPFGEARNRDNFSQEPLNLSKAELREIVSQLKEQIRFLDE